MPEGDSIARYAIRLRADLLGAELEELSGKCLSGKCLAPFGGL